MLLRRGAGLGMMLQVGNYEIEQIMSWIQLAAELLKEPAFLVFLFAVIIGCLLLCLCRNAVSSLLSRTRTIGTQGLSADPYSVLEKQPKKIETNLEAVQELLNQVGNSGLITQTEQSIHADPDFVGLVPNLSEIPL